MRTRLRVALGLSLGLPLALLTLAPAGAQTGAAPLSRSIGLRCNPLSVVRLPCCTPYGASVTTRSKVPGL